MTLTTILMLVAGILLIVGAIVTTIVCIARTPENLQGFYGAMFWSIAIVAIIGGVALIVFSFFK